MCCLHQRGHYRAFVMILYHIVLRWDEMRWDEDEWNQIRADEWDQIRSDQIHERSVLRWFIEAKWRLYIRGNYALIASANGLSPVQRRAIMWPNAGILSIGSLVSSVGTILINIKAFSLKKYRNWNSLLRHLGHFVQPHCVYPWRWDWMGCARIGWGLTG